MTPEPDRSLLPLSKAVSKRPVASEFLGDLDGRGNRPVFVGGYLMTLIGNSGEPSPDLPGA